MLCESLCRSLLLSLAPLTISKRGTLRDAKPQRTVTEATAYGTVQPQMATLSAAGAGVSGPGPPRAPRSLSHAPQTPASPGGAAALCSPLWFMEVSASGTQLEAAITDAEVPPTSARTPWPLPQTLPSPLVAGTERGRKGSESGRQGCYRPRRLHFKIRTGGWSQVGPRGGDWVGVSALTSERCRSTHCHGKPSTEWRPERKPGPVGPDAGGVALIRHLLFTSSSSLSV